jgi:hypothetical protein
VIGAPSVTVPAVLAKIALSPWTQGIEDVPSNQLAVDVFHVPAPPPPDAPQVRLCAPAGVKAVDDSSIAAMIVKQRKRREREA